jgi:heat shock protein HtpX
MWSTRWCSRPSEVTVPPIFITSLVSQVLLSFLATAIVMWCSRWRENRADASAASLADHNKMIAALRRLQTVHKPDDLPEQIAAFGIAGGIGQGLMSLFLSHPPLADRIAALEQNRG